MVSMAQKPVYCARRPNARTPGPGTRIMRTLAIPNRFWSCEGAQKLSPLFNFKPGLDMEELAASAQIPK